VEVKASNRRIRSLYVDPLPKNFIIMPDATAAGPRPLPLPLALLEPSLLDCDEEDSLCVTDCAASSTYKHAN